MSKEKMLIKMEEIGVFQRILNFFKKIFWKVPEEKNTYNMTEKINIKENNFINALEEERKIIEIQNKYELGILQEEDLTEEEKEKLIELYKEQINTLENNIINYQENLRVYKNRIIEMKNKI